MSKITRLVMDLDEKFSSQDPYELYEKYSLNSDNIDQQSKRMYELWVQTLDINSQHFKVLFTNKGIKNDN